jgi:hypothetical protein
MVDGEILTIWNYSIVSISNYEVTLVAERSKIGADSFVTRGITEAAALISQRWGAADVQRLF